MRFGMWPAILFGALLLVSHALVRTQTAVTPQQPANQTEWPSYGGGPDGIRYSPLTQINRSNVSQLQVAWTYDSDEGPGGTQCQPLVVGGVLYAVTPQHNIVALDAATGKQIWKFESGDVRAYDVRTGQMRWSFHTIPHPGEFGYKTWPKLAWKVSGSANNWAGMTVDAARGLVFVPTGSAASDFYGADRVGDDLFANTMLALDANTGKRVWHFQAVKHDIWDRDFPSQPALVRVKRGRKWVDAVAQTTKSGHVYLFERGLGKPLFPIAYRQDAPSDVPGEVAAKTQPLPLKPAPFARQVLTEDLLTNRTPEAHRWAVERFRTFHGGTQFVPFRVGQETIIFPGFDGGAEWGGPAFDPETGLLYVNANEMAWTSD